MSQIDTGENDLQQRNSTYDEADLASQAVAERGDIEGLQAVKMPAAGLSENVKLVPVSESIRYRKRAQVAEKQNEALSRELAEAKTKAVKMVEKLDDIRVEQELVRKLTSAGTIDLDTAVLIAKAQLKDSKDKDLDELVEQLKKDKQYLFDREEDGVVMSQRTAGARDRIVGSQRIIERAAKRAAATGNRADLQEYLKLRRNVV